MSRRRLDTSHKKKPKLSRDERQRRACARKISRQLDKATKAN